MSRVTTWHSAATQCLKCLKGRAPPEEYGSFSLSTEPVNLPLDVSLAREIQAFYAGWDDTIQRSRLITQRQNFCKELSKNVIRAYELVGKKRRNVTVQELYKPLAYLERALDVLMKQKDFDDQRPVAWEETKGLPGSEHLDPPSVWINIEMEYTKQCLYLLVHILAIVLPAHSEEWEEWFVELNGQQWSTTFILDSFQSQMASTPEHPRRRDVPLT